MDDKHKQNKKNIFSKNSKGGKIACNDENGNPLEIIKVKKYRITETQGFFIPNIKKAGGTILKVPEVDLVKKADYCPAYMRQKNVGVIEFKIGSKKIRVPYCMKYTKTKFKPFFYHSETIQFKRLTMCGYLSRERFGVK